MTKYQQSISPSKTFFKGLRIYRHLKSQHRGLKKKSHSPVKVYDFPHASPKKIVLTALLCRMLPSNLRAVPRRHWLTVDLPLRWILRYPIAVRLLPPKLPISCRPESSDWSYSTCACSFEGSRVDRFRRGMMYLVLQSDVDCQSDPVMQYCYGPLLIPLHGIGW